MVASRQREEERIAFFLRVRTNDEEEKKALVRSQVIVKFDGKAGSLKLHWSRLFGNHVARAVIPIWLTCIVGTGTSRRSTCSRHLHRFLRLLGDVNQFDVRRLDQLDHTPPVLVNQPWPLETEAEALHRGPASAQRLEFKRGFEPCFLDNQVFAQ